MTCPPLLWVRSSDDSWVGARFDLVLCVAAAACDAPAAAGIGGGGGGGGMPVFTDGVQRIFECLGAVAVPFCPSGD